MQRKRRTDCGKIVLVSLRNKIIRVLVSHWIMLDSPCIQMQIRSLRNDHILECDVPCRQMRVTKGYGGSPLAQESLLIFAKLQESSHDHSLAKPPSLYIGRRADCRDLPIAADGRDIERLHKAIVSSLLTQPNGNPTNFSLCLSLNLWIAHHCFHERPGCHHTLLK